MKPIVITNEKDVTLFNNIIEFRQYYLQKAAIVSAQLHKHIGNGDYTLVAAKTAMFEELELSLIQGQVVCNCIAKKYDKNIPLVL